MRKSTIFLFSEGARRQSSCWLDSMFQRRMFSVEAANKCSALASLKERCVMHDVSQWVTFMFWNVSKSQYFTVRSEEPFASAKFYGLNSRQVTAWPGCSKLARTLSAVTSQIFSEQSALPDATHFPSGEILRVLIAPVCSRKVATH